MPPIRVGIQLASLRLPFKQALHTAARLGAAAVEIDARHMLRPEELSQTGVRHIRKMLDDLGLRVCAVGFRTRRGYDVAADLDRRVEATKRAMEMAFKLGASAVINHVGPVPEKPEGAAWDQLLQALADLGRFGQHVGALLAATTGTEPGPRLASLIRALPEGSLFVNFDPGQLIVNGFSPREALESLSDHVIHVHATDAVRDLARGRGLATPLGRGSADWPEIVGALEERQYRGYFTVQCEASTEPLRDTEFAVQYLKNLGADS